jgi:hypothetical protein
MFPDTAFGLELPYIHQSINMAEVYWQLCILLAVVHRRKFLNTLYMFGILTLIQRRIYTLSNGNHPALTVPIHRLTELD